MVGKPQPFVSLHPIKEWAAIRLRADSTLRKVIESEEETVRASEFVAKLGVWLKILDI